MGKKFLDGPVLSGREHIAAVTHFDFIGTNFLLVLSINSLLDSFHNAVNVVFSPGGKYELVSAVAGGKVGVAYAAFDDGCHILERVIALKMTKGVIDLFKVIHIDHDNSVGFFGAPAGKFVDEFVETVAVADTGEGVNAGIGSDNKKIGIEHGGGVKHIEVDAGMQDQVNGRSRSAEKQKQDNKKKLPLEYLKGRDGVKNRKKHRTVTQDKPDYVSVSVYKEIPRI
jgi:hypothetical protein